MLSILLSLLPLLFTPQVSIGDFNSKADDATEEKILYIDLSLNEKMKTSDNLHLRLFGEDEVDVSLSLISNDIYKTNESISVAFLNNEEYHIDIYSSVDTYKSEDIQGGSLLKDYGYNYICLGEYLEGNNASIKGYGYYGELVKNPESTYLTQRVWLNNESEAFYEDDCVNALGYYYENKYQVIVMPSIQNSYDQRLYYYANIPYQVTSVHFLRLSNKENHNYLIYHDNYVELSYGVCYFTKYEDYKQISTGIVSKADAILLSMVVESYLTYGTSYSNGAKTSTVRNLFFTWFDEKSATSNELKNTKIKDYTGYASNGNSYEGLTKNSEFSVNEKWNTLCSQAGINSTNGSLRTFDMSLSGNTMKGLLIVGFVAVVFVSISLVIMILRKKVKR